MSNAKKIEDRSKRTTMGADDLATAERAETMSMDDGDEEQYLEAQARFDADEAQMAADAVEDQEARRLESLSELQPRPSRRLHDDEERVEYLCASCLRVFDWAARTFACERCCAVAHKCGVCHGQAERTAEQHGSAPDLCPHCWLDDDLREHGG
jgi:hypothetical protein